MKEPGITQVPLKAHERMAYLQAMDVTIWEPRSNSLVGSRLTDEQGFESESENELYSLSASGEAGLESVHDSSATTEFEQSGSQILSTISSNVDSLQGTETPADSSQSIAISTSEEDVYLPTDRQEIEIDSQAGSVQNKSIENNHNRFLKMVNWKSTNGEAKRLLVICRHQPDQPAQSFAQPGSPSGFMRDYLKALDAFFSNHEGALQVSLAHLTEAGIGSDNEPMSLKLEQLKPDLILLLGDEGVRSLFDSTEQVASFRGRLHQLGELSVLVSYHPYTLIKNPPLKKLAQEDLSLLVKVLSN